MVLRDAAFRCRLKSLALDLLVCAFSQVADAEFLGLMRLGCLNVHFSMLPQHRGREPLFYAMLAGRGAGVSVHWMTAGVDSGPVVRQEPLDTLNRNTLHRVILSACNLAARVVPAAIVKAVDHHPKELEAIAPLPMADWPSPKEVGRFKDTGARII